MRAFTIVLLLVLQSYQVVAADGGSCPDMTKIKRLRSLVICRSTPQAAACAGLGAAALGIGGAALAQKYLRSSLGKGQVPVKTDFMLGARRLYTAMRNASRYTKVEVQDFTRKHNQLLKKVKSITKEMDQLDIGSPEYERIEKSLQPVFKKQVALRESNPGIEKFIKGGKAPGWRKLYRPFVLEAPSGDVLRFSSEKFDDLDVESKRLFARTAERVYRARPPRSGKLLNKFKKVIGKKGALIFSFATLGSGGAAFFSSSEDECKNSVSSWVNLDSNCEHVYKINDRVAETLILEEKELKKLCKISGFKGYINGLYLSRFNNMTFESTSCNGNQIVSKVVRGKTSKENIVFNLNDEKKLSSIAIDKRAGGGKYRIEFASQSGDVVSYEGKTSATQKVYKKIIAVDFAKKAEDSKLYKRVNARMDDIMLIQQPLLECCSANPSADLKCDHFKIKGATPRVDAQGRTR